MTIDGWKIRIVLQELSLCKMVTERLSLISVAWKKWWWQKEKFYKIEEHIHHCLLAAKLKLFGMVAGKMNSFLRGFQADVPMTAFMADTIGDLVCDFLRRIVLKDILKKCSSLYNLIQLNLLDENIRKPPESIDVGFVH